MEERSDSEATEATHALSENETPPPVDDVQDEALAESMPAASPKSAAASMIPAWRRFRRGKAFLPTIIAVPVLAALAIGLGIFLPWEFSKVALPDLTGLTLPEAENTLLALDADLRFEIDVAPKSSLEEFWAVSGQDPAPGTRVLPNSPVLLSGDLIDVTVPSLATLTSPDVVQDLLATQGLTGEVAFAYIDGSTITGIESIDPLALSALLDDSGIHGEASSNGIPFAVTVDSSFLTSDMASVVIPSDVAGTKVKAGSIIDLVLVPPITVVPNIVGMSVADARSALSSAHLAGNFGLSDDWFTVQLQAPAAATPFMVGSDLIAVTAGPDLAAFPALDGGTWAQIIKNPDAYEGTRAVLYGEVVQFDVNTGACSFRMQTGPAQTEHSFDYDQNTFVNAGASNCDLLGPIVQDDHLRIWATVTGAYTYSTTIGGSATALELEIWHFDVLPRQEY